MTPQPGQRADAQRTFVGVGWALLMVAVFVGFNIVSRLGAKAQVSPWDLGALRFAIGGLIMLPFFLRHGLGGLRPARAGVIAFLGGLGFAIFAYAGFSQAPASHGAVFIHGMLPFFTILVGLCLGSTVSRRARPGLGLIFAGSALTIATTVRVSTMAELEGDAWLLLAALCWSSCGVLIGRAGLPSTIAAPMIVVLSACVYLPLYLVFGDPAGLLSVAPDALLVQAVFQGVIIGALSIFVYARAVEHLGANVTAVFSAAIPGLTALAAIPVLSERATAMEWVAIGLLTAGMLVTFLVRIDTGRRDGPPR